MLNKKDLEEKTKEAIKWIEEYVKKSGMNGVVVGNSGGKDSATVIAMATRAIGKENVITLFMPCNSHISDFEDAKLVANTFNVEFLNINLKETYNNLKEEINMQLKNNKTLSDEALINIKPRLRMTTLYAVAQTLNYLVIGTGNLSEAMVGYTTKWGDNSYDFNPIGNFTVEEVLAIGEMLGVPKQILTKAPNDGLGGQTDEEKMGIKYSQISEMIETGNTEEMAKKEIINRFKKSEHKRKSIPVYTFSRNNYLLDNEVKK